MSEYETVQDERTDEGIEERCGIAKQVVNYGSCGDTRRKPRRWLEKPPSVLKALAMYRSMGIERHSKILHQWQVWKHGFNGLQLVDNSIGTISCRLGWLGG